LSLFGQESFFDEAPQKELRLAVGYLKITPQKTIYPVLEPRR
jgi:hypothetical protein